MYGHANPWLARESALRWGAVRVPNVPMNARSAQVRITYVLDLFRGDHERELSKAVLSVMLDALFRIDCLYLQSHPDAPLLYHSGVRYMEEPPGQEDWQDVPTTIALGIADCEDLACWRAAELNVRFGIAARPIFKEQKLPGGRYLYHILVLYPNGQVEDPSRLLGMY